MFIQSGVENGVTLGTPISLFVANEDQRPSDYSSKYVLLSLQIDLKYHIIQI